MRSRARAWLVGRARSPALPVEEAHQETPWPGYGAPPTASVRRGRAAHLTSLASGTLSVCASAGAPVHRTMPDEPGSNPNSSATKIPSASMTKAATRNSTADARRETIIAAQYRRRFWAIYAMASLIHSKQTPLRLLATPKHAILSFEGAPTL
jgi:hypothetical protein